MKSATIIITLVSLFTTSTFAHPPIFAPNHAQLQKRCPPFDPAGVSNIGNGSGKQFIGGQCLSTADCASGCCATPCGICSGVGASFQAGKTGCGFGGGATGSNANANAGSGNSNGNADANQNTGGGGTGNTGDSSNNNANSNSDANDNNGGTSNGSNNNNSNNGAGSSCNNA